MTAITLRNCDTQVKHAHTRTWIGLWRLFREPLSVCGVLVKNSCVKFLLPDSLWLLRSDFTKCWRLMLIFFPAHISLCLYKHSFLKFCNCQCGKKQAAFLLGSAVMGVLRPFTQEVPWNAFKRRERTEVQQVKSRFWISKKKHINVTWKGFFPFSFLSFFLHSFLFFSSSSLSFSPLFPIKL